MNDSTIVTDSTKRFKWVGTRPIRPDGVPKVTGRALYGADLKLPGMLYGKILRSPHAHARIKGIDTSAAAKLPGVKSVVTWRDFPEQKDEFIGPERVAQNYHHITRNIMAREKALYEGHAIAAVAATSASVAEEAAALIKVDYEVLPHVIDVDEAMAPDAPLLFENMITRSVEPPPTKPSNISKRLEFSIGNVEEGFRQADLILENEYKTAAVHQGYIEPHACVAKAEADGQVEMWTASQGHFTMRGLVAKLCAIPLADIRAMPAEIGGGFGGKTVTYLEPVAVMLSKKAAGLPVRLQMTREEVFKASGPTSGTSSWVRIGFKKDGTIVALDAIYKYQAGAFPGSPVMNGCLCGVGPYNLANARTVGYDVVSNRPKAAAYRAPGSPIGSFPIECTIDEAAQKLGIDPIDIRLKNVARLGTPMIAGNKMTHAGFAETLEALKAHPAYQKPLGKNQGRGVACGYWFNAGGESSATLQVNHDGTVLIASGSMDIGGSRASMAIMAAETLGVDYTSVRSIIADTASVGYCHVTGGSRTTYATGIAVVEATRSAITELCKRAAKIWQVDPEAVVWEDGYAKPASSNVGDFKPLSLKEIAAQTPGTGGPITTSSGVNPSQQAPGFSAQFYDIEVDPETGRTDILKVVCAQDVGRAIHPGYVEGQMHGGITQGIGWALNEEYIYNAKGLLDNAGFLDYRMPVASDLPYLDTIMVEVPNPAHPYGAKGVGEACFCPPISAIANAMERAIGKRIKQLPLSPPRVLEAIDG